MVGAVVPGVEGLWAHLAEPAAFFDVAIPPADALADALVSYVASCDAILTAVTVTVVAGESRYAITGAAVRPVHSDAVRIERCDLDVPLTLPEDPYWRRMAARTTSRADRDRLRAWLDGRGYADAVTAAGDCTPFLGALVWERDGEVVGVDNPEPTSVLDQMQRCGAIDPVRRVQHGPAAVDVVWWLSSDFQLHPVSTIGDTVQPISGAAPAFARLS